MTEQHVIAASISDAELEVLRQLWEEAPLSAQEIIERLDTAGSGSTHPKTVKSLINRLLRKGALSYHEKQRKYYYYPRIDQEAFYTHKTEDFLDRFFDGEVTPLLSFFTRRKKLDEKELQELKALIRQLETDHDE